MHHSLPDAQWPLFKRMVRCTVRVENPANGNIGAGVVISKRGLVLTAYHVVVGSKKARIKRCRLSDGGWDIVTEGRYVADVVFEDRNADIAVLLMRKPPKTLKCAELGDSEHLKIGQAVYRVGMDEYRMDGGHIIEIKGSTEVGKRRLRIPEISVSMRTNVGASGGPVFDTDLALVGISLRCQSSEKSPPISYVLPIHAVRRRIFRRTAVRTHLDE